MSRKQSSSWLKQQFGDYMVLNPPLRSRPNESIDCVGMDGGVWQESHVAIECYK